jgi:hypothetical protein
VPAEIEASVQPKGDSHVTDPANCYPACSEVAEAITVIEGWGSGGGIGIVGVVLIILVVLYVFGGLRLSS